MKSMERHSSGNLASWIALALLTVNGAVFAQDTRLDLAPASQPATGPATQGMKSMFFDPTDGAIDITGFLDTRVGFLPLAMPITEPAVGLGIGVGLTFFHDRPHKIPGKGDEPARLIMPSTSVLIGAGTENGTWAAGLGHLGIWDKGRIRYLGAGGYAEAHLDWYGVGDAFNGRSISYVNEVIFLLQRLTFQLGETDFHFGPQYLFVSTDSTFSFSALNPNIPEAEFDSRTSGIGLILNYDSLDQPFSPTRGIKSEVAYSQFAQGLGGDFDYGQLQTYGIMYAPLGGPFVLGVNLNGQFIFGDAPFYSLPFLGLRGIPMGRYVDSSVVSVEAELRYDLTQRWTLLAFGGAGRVADTIGDLFDADDHFSGGAGIRYLIAREYGLRMGVDVAYGDDDLTVYVTVGTGWVRP